MALSLALMVQGIAKLLLLFFVHGLVAEATPLYNVLDYGAKGNCQTDNTQAFLKAWGAACADPSTPTLLIPSGKSFLLNQILFEGPCKSSIHVQLLGKLTAPNKIWTQKFATWILFKGINNLTIDGSGQIDGQGQIWWNCKAKKQCNGLSPYSFGIMSCQDVKISGLNFINSPGKHLTVHKSARVSMNSLTITAPENSPNTDGIMIMESQNVQVFDSKIGTGDDCIAIGTGSSDVNITRIKCGPGHGISIGSLGADKSEGKVERIRVYNCSFINTLFGARIKTYQGGYGFARNISFEKIKFNSVYEAITIDQYYCNGGSSCPNSTSAIQVSDVSFLDARGSASRKVAIRLACSESHACTGIHLRDVSITPVPGMDQQSSYCLNAVGTKEGQISPDVSCLCRV